MIASPEPSPLIQAIVYMVGMLLLAGALAYGARAWRTVQAMWGGRRR